LYVILGSHRTGSFHQGQQDGFLQQPKKQPNNLVVGPVSFTIALLVIVNVMLAHTAGQEQWVVLTSDTSDHLQGKFPEAEVEFIKAGKPKEAVLMWVHVSPADQELYEAVADLNPVAQCN